MITILVGFVLTCACLGIIMFATYMETRGCEVGFKVRKDKTTQSGPKNVDRETS